MAKAVATPKQTGGGGFTFEDAVSARFLLFMLSGRPPLYIDDGLIDTIGFQTRVDGWLLDDLLLTLAAGDTRRSFAISVKSNSKSRKSACPPIS